MKPSNVVNNLILVSDVIEQQLTMFLESIIGVCVVLYLIWKFLLTGSYEEKKQTGNYKSNETPFEQINKRTCQPSIKCMPVRDVAKDPAVSVEETKEIFNDILQKPKCLERRKNLSTLTYEILKDEKVVTPSQLLKRQREKEPLENLLVKRDSPPKERLAEFLEKNILSNDKIQSIIQNLSLDKTEIFKNEDPSNVCATEELIPNLHEKRSAPSDKALILQKSIDNIADKIKQLNEFNINKINDSVVECEKEIVEEKPLIKRLQKQAGVPSGLNFGSVIGELRLKTKSSGNGSLKPVFRKFDIDTDAVDNAQACKLYIFSFNFIKQGRRKHKLPRLTTYSDSFPLKHNNILTSIVGIATPAFL